MSDMIKFQEYARLRESVAELDAAGVQRFVQSAPVAVVMYGSQVCRYCVMSMPWVSELSDQGHAIAKVDVDRHSDAAEEAGLATLPTFDVYHNGVRTERITGAKKFSVQKVFGAYPHSAEPT